MTEKLNTGVL